MSGYWEVLRRTNKPLFIVLYIGHESLQWPESSLKFNKNVVTYATLTEKVKCPSNPEANLEEKAVAGFLLDRI